MELWKAARMKDAPVDLIIPPDFQTEVKMRLDEAQIPFVISIADLQAAIANENPNVTSEIDEEFDNRFSKTKE